MTKSLNEQTAQKVMDAYRKVEALQDEAGYDDERFLPRLHFELAALSIPSDERETVNFIVNDVHARVAHRLNDEDGEYFALFAGELGDALTAMSDAGRRGTTLLGMDPRDEYGYDLARWTIEKRNDLIAQLLQLSRRLAEEAKLMRADTTRKPNSLGLLQGAGVELDRMCGEYALLVELTERYRKHQLRQLGVSKD